MSRKLALCLPTLLAMSTLSMSAAAVTVTIAPTRAPVTLKQQRQFSASVTGESNTTVTWLVDGVVGGNATVGSISAAGLYTPPDTAGTHSVTARSNADSQASASAEVWVTNYPGMMTYHGDKYRSGVNYQELALSSSTVNRNSFGKLFSLNVDGQIYAQPLYVANFNLNGTYHNVLFVATQHDGVYAFDADAGGNPLWYRSFIDPAHGITTQAKPPKGLISPEIGITSTPVIDMSTQTLYVLAVTVENGKVLHRLHALSLTSGAEQFGGPIQISGSYAGATFTSSQLLQRPALALLNGVVYIAFGSQGDALPYQGWLFGYSGKGGTLHQTAVFCTAPKKGAGAIWMSGGAPAIDDSGYLYVVTANGEFDLNTGGKDAGDTVLKLNASLQIVDYYTPSNWQELLAPDWDLGSAGVMLPPYQKGAKAPDLVIAGGKDGLIYLVNRDNMGHFNANHDPAVQKVALGAPEPNNGNWFTPTAWQSWIYFGAVNEPLTQYQFSSGLLGGSAVAESSHKFPYPGTTPMLSSQGTNAIVWTLDNSAYFGGTPDGGVNTPGPAVLHAYRADNVGVELYNSAQAGTRDTCGTAIKFTAPTIANGHVYVGGAKVLTAYGLLP